MVSAIPTLSTSRAPIDETYGTTTDASPMDIGDFKQLSIGVRINLVIQVLRERYADTWQTGFIAVLMCR